MSESRGTTIPQLPSVEVVDNQGVDEGISSAGNKLEVIIDGPSVVLACC